VPIPSKADSSPYQIPAVSARHWRLVGSNYSQLELHVIPELLVEQGLTDSSCPQWELCSVPALALHHWGLVGSNYSQEELYLIPEVPADGWGFVHANCARLELCLVP